MPLLNLLPSLNLKVPNAIIRVDIWPAQLLKSAPKGSRTVQKRGKALVKDVSRSKQKKFGSKKCEFNSLILYFCSWVRRKDAAKPRWLLRLMQCWFLLILWPKENVNMFLVFWFVPLSLSYEPKHEGHPFKVKGITEILSWC